METSKRIMKLFSPDPPFEFFREKRYGNTRTGNPLGRMSNVGGV